jgi:hypothetical protein
MAIIWVGSGRFNAYIGPVQDCIDRVVAADVAAGNTLGLEVGVRDAYDVFIRDSIDVGHLGTSGGVLSQANSIIKAAPIMAGARTMAGALVPLVGPAPTAFGSAGGWNYNRKTGLAGNGIDNYLNSNRAGNADPQNSKHVAVYTSLFNGQGGILANRSTAGATYFDVTGGSLRLRINVSSNVNDIFTNTNVITGLVGGSRTGATTGTIRYSGTNVDITTTSETPQADTILAYARRNSSTGAAELFASHRFSFYSIGEALDLALIDVRLTALMAAIAAAIP